MKSKLTQYQVKKLTFNKDNQKLIVKLQYDDNCGNGHNTFSITGALYTNSFEDSFGCIHNIIAKFAPKLKHLFKWHLCSSDGPMHYIANTMYYAKGVNNPDSYHMDIEGTSIKIVNQIEKEKYIKKYGKNVSFRVIKDSLNCSPDLDAAREIAIWPDAKLSDFTEENLKKRLPNLLKEFKGAMESLGFVY